MIGRDAFSTGRVSEPMVNGIHPKRGRNSDITRTLSALALCLCVILLASCSKHYDDPGWVAKELVEAFVAADLERAQRVTVPEQWDRVEKWMDGRQTFKCRGRGTELGDPWGASGSGHYDAAGNEWNYGFLYQCPDRYTPYCLDVSDIRVIETADGWRVAGWGRICEAPDYAYLSSETCR